MRAKMLHLSHENFVKVLKVSPNLLSHRLTLTLSLSKLLTCDHFQNTITNVEKLLASADDLVVNGEFEPQDIYNMTKELEQRMTVFLQRVEKRKNILDLSVLFHTHVVELDNWFGELKLHWTALNLNDINQSNPANLDIINHSIELFEKHLEILNEQKTVTGDAIEKTMLEGNALLEHLKEVNVKTDGNNPNDSTGSGKTDKQSNSYIHLEGIVNSVKTHYQDIDGLLSTIKSKLESNLHVKLFEKDAMEASQNLEHWAEELKYLEAQIDEARSTENTESWLHNQVQTANQMKVLIFELLQRGSDLVTQLEKSEGVVSTLSPLAEVNEQQSLDGGVESLGSPSSSSGNGSSTPTSQHTLNWLKQQNGLGNASIAASNGSLNKSTDSSSGNNQSLTAKQRIQSFVEYLNEREKELHELAIKQQRRLGQTLQINQLENECSQLLGFISNVEMTLFGMLKFARNLDEAEAIKKVNQ